MAVFEAAAEVERLDPPPLRKCLARVLGGQDVGETLRCLGLAIAPIFASEHRIRLSPTAS